MCADISQLPTLDWMPSRYPKLKALVTFVADDGSGCPPAVELAMWQKPCRWYPEPGGHRVLILYEGGAYDATVFHVEPDAWDHEHCNVCKENIPPMTLCHVTKHGRCIILCERCYQIHVVQKTEPPS